MKSRAALCLLLCSPLVALSAYASGDEMPLVGLDKDHHPVVQMISESSYVDQMQKALNGIHQQVQAVLKKKEQAERAAPALSTSKSPWRLRTIAVGINANFTAGLGFLGGATINPRFRLVYTNSTHPVFPD